MTNGNTRHYAADEIVAPALIALKAWYDEARGSKPVAPSIFCRSRMRCPGRPTSPSLK